jgi:tetratricopeptide (TPR) repeat protein
MSFKAIKELRQGGKLEEALIMADQALEAEPDNIWNKRAAAWVYYDYLKINAHPEKIDSFKINLLKIKALSLPADEKMVFDNCAWQIGAMVFALQKEEYLDFNKVTDIFEIIKDFHFTKPSEAYSFIYKAFHKMHENWSAFLAFADWWNFDNFRSEDYIKDEFNGKKIMSIVEQSYIAYSKKLLDGEFCDPNSQHKVIDKEKIEAFLPKLDYVIEKYPDYQYPPYFKAKLLLALGNDENVLAAFLPFAKQKRNDFWVWELMVGIFHEDKETRFACYCKALSLKTPEDFLVKLRQTFTEILIEKQMFNEAKTEIEKIIATREKHGWNVTQQVKIWMDREWFKTAISYHDNIKLYNQYLNHAEQLLYQDIAEEHIVIEFVNENKNVINFVKDKTKYGFFNYSGYLHKPQIGDILSVRFRGSGQEGFYKIVSAKPAEINVISEAIKVFRAPIKMNLHQNFGFASDIFVESRFINELNLKNSQLVEGKAILSFNKKKNEWGWKVITIKPVTI